MNAPLLPFGAGAVMASRVEDLDSLDFFPTPPWATRALFAHVLPAIGVHQVGLCAEPACGEGHMAAVIDEYQASGFPVFASDLGAYGYGKGGVNFLSADRPPLVDDVDWIFTNPPFNCAVEFVLRALQLARVGVAVLCRTAWLEGADRYARLFSAVPPAVFAPFVERVAMVKGRYDPDASTATSYAWFVWLARPNDPTATMPGTFWIPPCRKLLTRETDRARFAAWSVTPQDNDEVEQLARGLVAAGDPEQPIANVRRIETLTYRESRAISPAALNGTVRVPAWQARRRAADDLVARRLTIAALKGAA